MEATELLRERGRNAFAKNWPTRFRGRKGSSYSSGSGSTVDFQRMRSHLKGKEFEYVFNVFQVSN